MPSFVICLALLRFCRLTPSKQEVGPRRKKMKPLSSFLLTFLLLLLPPHIIFSSPSRASEVFEAWCKQHGRTYFSEAEKLYRYRVFQDNFDFVMQHNDMGNSSYTLSLNAFADLTHHEFKASRLGFSAAGMNFNRRRPSRGPGSVVREIPSEMDWRKKGAVTLVKDQGSCGMTMPVLCSVF